MTDKEKTGKNHHKSPPIDEMKSHFLAMMSHEIRTPMQSIYGLLELLSHEKMSDDAENMIDTARNAASDLLEILDDALDIAKVDAGKMELDIFDIPIRTLAYGVIECMEVKIHDKNISLTAEIDDNVPSLIMGDPTRLRQILLNLVGNAIKFTRKGDITLKITKNAQNFKNTDDITALRFEIIDTGIGMDDKTAQKLFKPFIQADISITRKYGGTGLGLSICQKFVHLMGGEIGVESTKNLGSSFWFELPTTAKDNTDINQLDDLSNMPDLSGLAILSVEDHPQGAREIKRTLSRMGAGVTSVHTYKDGADILEKRRFDIAIIDQGLPDGMGIDLIRKIIYSYPSTGTIMYTVRDDIGLQHSIKTLGTLFLSKPASRLGLAKAVQQAYTIPTTQVTLHNNSSHILIAEDNKAVQDILKRQLNILGIQADFANNGTEALDKLNNNNNSYGLIITDLHMPETDGYELVEHIRTAKNNTHIFHYKDCPVIAFTADVQISNAQEYLTLGFNEYLLKPASLGQLRQMFIRLGILTHTEKTSSEKAFVKKTHTSIDKEAIIKNMGCFDDDAIEMVGIFLKMSEKDIDNIKKHYEDNDIEQLKDSCHSLTGAAYLAGCTKLGTLTCDLEKKCHNSEDIPKGIVNDIIHEFKNIQNELDFIKTR